MFSLVVVSAAVITDWVVVVLGPVNLIVGDGVVVTVNDVFASWVGLEAVVISCIVILLGTTFVIAGDVAVVIVVDIDG